MKKKNTGVEEIIQGHRAKPLCAASAPRANDASRLELANDEEGTKRESVS